MAWARGVLAGLAATLPSALFGGLTSHGVSHGTANAIANQPPVGSLFSAFLGYNPVKNLLGSQGLSTLSPSNQATLTGHEFFPNLISGPFHHGLIIVFSMAIAMSLIGALASLFRGTKYVHQDGQVAVDARKTVSV